MNMRVALFLDLVNKTKGPAREAKRDILDLKRATRDLGHSSGTGDAARDLERLARSAQRARREYVKMALEARKARRGFGAGTGGEGAGGQSGPGKGGGKGGGTAILPGTRGMLAAGVSMYALKKGIDATIGSSIRFEAAFADVQKKVDLPVGKTWDDLRRTIVRNAIAFGRSREEIAALTAEAGAAGIAYEDLTDWTRLSTKAAIGWDMSADQTSQKLAEIRAATGWTIKEMEEFADKVNYLGDTSAAKEADILEMFQRAASAANAAGVSFDISLASLTALRSIGMREETSARFFNAFTSKLRTATTLPKKAAAGFKRLGTSAKAVEKGMKTDALGTMLDLLRRLENSPDKAAAALAIFGQEWWDEAARMGRAIPEIIKNLEGLASGQWAGSLEKNLNIELSTTANHLERLKALSSEVGDRFGKWALPGINEKIELLIGTLDRLDGSANLLQRNAAEQKAKQEELKRRGIQPEPSSDFQKSTQKSLINYPFGIAFAAYFAGQKAQKQAGDYVFGKEGKKKEETADAQRRGREAAEQIEEDMLLQHMKRAQYREDWERKIKNGSFWSYFARKQLEDLHEWDKRVEPIQRRRLSENDEQLARHQQGPYFTPQGPRYKGQKPKQLPLTIGPGGIYDFGLTLGSDGSIIDQKAAKAGQSDNLVLPKAIASSAVGGVQNALGSDMRAAGQQAMSSYAAGITSGGSQAVAAANAVVSQVNAALSLAGAGVKVGHTFGGRLNGSLHDGSTGGGP